MSADHTAERRLKLPLWKSKYKPTRKISQMFPIRGGEGGIGKHPISLLIMPLCNGSFLSHICNRVFARYKHFQIIIPPCYGIGNISVYWLYHNMFINVTLYLCSLGPIDHVFTIFEWEQRFGISNDIKILIFLFR